MKSDIHKDIDSLILGINAILLKNRCSFSEEEIVQLNDSISYLNEFKKSKSKTPINTDLIVKVFELLLKMLTSIDLFMKL